MLKKTVKDESEQAGRQNSQRKLSRREEKPMPRKGKISR